ncbi:tyrosine-protein phosphatase [Streptomyces sp. NPDC015346]|uniref:tyrosine-protein phosphatase n=1 Tax=Streptomyces sp. NPDC015346 TaxID=3364954 RepID=UPI0036FC3BA7
MNRHLDWEGCFNTRDLGGIPTRDGRTTARGALVRSDAVHRLTARGWQRLWEYGVRTVIDLRNADEPGEDAAPRPAGLTTLRIPLHPAGAVTDGIWGRGTPLAYRAFLRAHPGQTAAVLAAVAAAKEGGVLFHCAVGRDRTGLVSLVLLALAGVSPAEIAADYDLSADRLSPLFAAVGEPDPRHRLAALLAREGTTVRGAVEAALDSFDPEAHLGAGGLSGQQIAAVRTRLTAAS